jgi:hypothetical protein
MRGLIRGGDITFGSRYECKYLIAPEVAGDLRVFLTPFVEPDAYASRHPKNRYPICSLYYDTEDLRLYQQTVTGQKKRFKLRARTYDDDPRSPVFLEVKRKINNIVQKRRVAATRDQARELTAGGFNGRLRELSAAFLEDIEYFSSHRHLTGAKPVVRVRYTREAYQSRGGDPVRITLDTDLSHAMTLNEEYSHSAGRWVSTPVAGTILEIKFTDRFPHWVEDLVRIFGLKQQPVPKYVLSLDRMMSQGQGSVFALAGITIPPLRA